MAGYQEHGGSNSIFIDVRKVPSGKDLSALLDYARNLGLEQLRAVRYSFPLPGMSHWPQSLKLRYTLFTLNNAVMSRFGSEHVLLFRRAG